MKENLFTHDNFSRQRTENINTLKIVIFLYINAFVRLDVSVFDNLIKHSTIRITSLHFIYPEVHIKHTCIQCNI